MSEETYPETTSC